MSIHIRPALRGDRDRLVEIVEQQDNFLRCEKEIAREVIDASFDPAQGYHLDVAEVSGGRLVGFILYGPIPLTENRYDIYWIAVDPGNGRNGIGSLLLAGMERRIGDGGGRIYIDTSSTAGYQPARKFYKKHGYRLIARLEHFYRDGDHRFIYCKMC